MQAPAWTSDAFEHVWVCLAAQLGAQLRVLRTEETTGFVLTACGRTLRMPACQPPLKCTEVRYWAAEAGLTLASPGPQPHAQRNAGAIEINTDLAAPLATLLTLREEHEAPQRDRFGLVEARRSPRTPAQLCQPLLENAAAWLGSLLNVRPPTRFPGGKSWAVAVSSDVDVVTSDHMPAVLDFLARHGVQRPSFMVCTPSADERCMHDPQYSLCDPATRRMMEPLRQGQVEIGLHGSYLAHDRPEMLSAQRLRLEDWCERPVIGHRAHFYRFAYPRSWAAQARSGFIYDASLGYPDLPGLRNGCAGPTEFNDPEFGRCGFWIQPTILLDQHFFWPQPWDRAAFEAFADRLIATAARARTVLCLDWHTYTLGEFPGWWDRLDGLLTRATAAGAYVAGIGSVLSCYAALAGRLGPAA